jgi:hypothetical protein
MPTADRQLLCPHLLPFRSCTACCYSADDLGDMFFDMLEVLPFPIACPNGTNTS